MVGVVLVGHSADVVRGLAAMIRQAAPHVPVETAGGLVGGRIGTSGDAVATALRVGLETSRGDGVIVFLDLGSAALALDIALEGLTAREAERVRVTEAPFVEGAVLAAIAAAGGADLDAVVLAAEGAAALPKIPRDESRVAAGRGPSIASAWLRSWAIAVHERREWLTDLDAAIGDGDHGINLDRGLRAVVADLDAGGAGRPEAGAVLGAAGRRIMAVTGGACGALYGRALVAAGGAVAPDGAEQAPDLAHLGERALDAAIAAIVALGKASPGDKTMLDALVPALDGLRTSSGDLPASARLAIAADRAEDGARATIPLVARKGRASYLGERSIGHMDPGAASAAMLVRSLADVARDVDR